MREQAINRFIVNVFDCRQFLSLQLTGRWKLVFSYLFARICSGWVFAFSKILSYSVELDFENHYQGYISSAKETWWNMILGDSKKLRILLWCYVVCQEQLSSSPYQLIAPWIATAPQVELFAPSLQFNALFTGNNLRNVHHCTNDKVSGCPANR